MRRVREPTTTSAASCGSVRGRPRQRATSLPWPLGMMPRLVARARQRLHRQVHQAVPTHHHEAVDAVGDGAVGQVLGLVRVPADQVAHPEAGLLEPGPGDGGGAHPRDRGRRSGSSGARSLWPRSASNTRRTCLPRRPTVTGDDSPDPNGHRPPCSYPPPTAATSRSSSPAPTTGSRWSSCTGHPAAIVADAAFTEAAAANGPAADRLLPSRATATPLRAPTGRPPRRSPTTPPTSRRSSTTSATTASSPSAGPAGGRGRWPARRCFPAAAWRPCAASGWCRPRSTTATSATGMGEENVAEFTAAMAGPEALMAWLEAEAGWVFSVTGAEIAESLGSLAPPVDRAALTGERAETAAAGFRRAGVQGFVGWRDDDLALVRPWGFSVRDITVPVAVWQGTEDMMVPARPRGVADRAHPRRAGAHRGGRGPRLAARPDARDPRGPAGAGRPPGLTPRLATRCVFTRGCRMFGTPHGMHAMGSASSPWEVRCRPRSDASSARRTSDRLASVDSPVVRRPAARTSASRAAPAAHGDRHSPWHACHGKRQTSCIPW